MDSFGERLKREREKRGVTLDEVSVATKIGTRMLRALEEERFDQLPGGIFNKGFVRAYAQQLGLDEDQAVADYLAAAGQNDPESRPESSQSFPLEVPEEKKHRSLSAEVPWGWLAVALLLLAVGFAAWSLHSRGREAKQESVQPPGAGAASPAKQEAEPANTSQVEAGTPQATKTREPVPTNPKQTREETTGTSVPLQPLAAQASAGTFTVLIKARGDSWLSISADGKEVMQDTMVAPAEKAVAARSEVTVKAGNVGALEFTFNGSKLPAQGDYGQVKTLVFHSGGLQAPSAPLPPAPEETPPNSNR